MTLISMFFAPVCTTSSSDLTVSLTVSSRVMSSLWFFSRNSRTVLDERPIAFACAWGTRQLDETAKHVQEEGETRLPRAVDATRLGLVEAWARVLRVEAHNEGGDAEWTDTTGLRVALRHVSSCIAYS